MSGGCDSEAGADLASGSSLPHDAVEQLAATGRSSALVLLCEHASAALPARWSWPAEDRWLLDTHWAYDIGAATLARELAAASGAAALLACFSRLLVDANRAPDDPSLFLRAADSRPVVLNRGIAAADQARRKQYWRAYHLAAQRLVRSVAAPVVLAVHSFTRCYQGERRDGIEVGVLFDQEGELAQRVADAVAARGLAVALNRPYSGQRGMIYSASRHARASGKQAVEIEVRQDRVLDEDFRARLVEALCAAPWVA